MKELAKPFVALAAVGAVAIVVAATGNASGAAGSGTRTMTFLSIQQQFATVPPASKSAPPQVGTRFIFRDVSYNRAAQFGKPAGALIGRAEGVCTLIALAAKPAAQCMITAHLPDGQVVIAAEGDPGAKVTKYAIVGGIGAYANARGFVTATALSETKSVIVAHLST
jgi:hypothetical protein